MLTGFVEWLEPGGRFVRSDKCTGLRRPGFSKYRRFRPARGGEGLAKLGGRDGWKRGLCSLCSVSLRRVCSSPLADGPFHPAFIGAASPCPARSAFLPMSEYSGEIPWKGLTPLPMAQAFVTVSLL